jgi:hypothetical protein
MIALISLSPLITAEAMLPLRSSGCLIAMLRETSMHPHHSLLKGGNIHAAQA